jgi:hypothetical protein
MAEQQVDLLKIDAAYIEREWDKLKAAKVSLRSPEAQAFMRKVVARDNYLYDVYGKPLEAEHTGQYVAISLKGETILGDNERAVFKEAENVFGARNFAVRRIGYSPVKKLRGPWRRA